MADYTKVPVDEGYVKGAWPFPRSGFVPTEVVPPLATQGATLQGSINQEPQCKPGPKLNIASGEDAGCDECPSWLHEGEMTC